MDLPSTGRNLASSSIPARGYATRSCSEPRVANKRKLETASVGKYNSPKSMSAPWVSSLAARLDFAFVGHLTRLSHSCTSIFLGCCYYLWVLLLFMDCFFAASTAPASLTPWNSNTMESTPIPPCSRRVASAYVFGVFSYFSGRCGRFGGLCGGRYSSIAVSMSSRVDNIVHTENNPSAFPCSVILTCFPGIDRTGREMSG